MRLAIPQRSKLLVITLFAIIVVQPLCAQWRLKTLCWNIESADSDINTIANYLEELEGYDIIGLCEVDPTDAQRLTQAAAYFEGAKGQSNTDFHYVISETGNDSRLMIIWDNIRFELLNQAVELNNLNSEWMGHRSPLYVKLRNRKTNESFIYMMNHLARGDEILRQSQASGLVTWLTEQTDPVIACGDYNFDYDIDDGVGNNAFQLMTDSKAWTWLKPESLIKSQSSFSYNSILDFVFIGNKPENWSSSSRVLSTQSPFIDDDIHSDHRPIEATFFIHPMEGTATTD